MKLKTSEVLYLGCYILYIFTCYLFTEITYKPRAMLLFCPIIAIGVCISIILGEKQPCRVVLFKLLTIFVFCVAALVSIKPQVLVCGVLVCGADLTSFKKIIVSSIFTCVFIIIMTSMLNSVGIIRQETSYSRFGVDINTFGFGYYSIVPFTYLFIVLGYLYLKYKMNKKVSWIGIMLILLVNRYLYRTTTLRLVFYLNYLTIFMYIILIKFGWFNLKNKILKFIIALIFPALFFVTNWMSYAYDERNSIFVKLNKLLSTRLSLGHEAFERYNINLWGNYIITNSDENNYFYIDSGFLYSLLGYGSIFTILLLSMYVYMHIYSAKVNDKMLFIWLTIVAVFSCINNTWISVQFNPLILSLPFIIKKMNDRKKCIVVRKI